MMAAVAGKVAVPLPHARTKFHKAEGSREIHLPTEAGLLDYRKVLRLPYLG